MNQAGSKGVSWFAPDFELDLVCFVEAEPELAEGSNG